MKPETQSILSFTERPYDEYNATLPLIKQKLGDRTPIFEHVLVEELPFTTLRRSCRTGIMVACGEDKVYRETEHQKSVPEHKKGKRPAKKATA